MSRSRSQYLFGLEEEEYANLPYKEALDKQKKSANHLYATLYKEGREFERLTMISLHIQEIESLIKILEDE